MNIEEIIKKTFVFTHDFMRDKSESGEVLYNAHKEHLMSFLVPSDVKVSESLWNDEVGKKFCNDLSPLQKTIILKIVNDGGVSTIEAIEKEVKAKGFNWLNNYTLGSSLGGASRKCKMRYKIPNFYYWDWSSETYRITDEALPYIKKYINC